MSTNPINLKLKSFARFDDAMTMCDFMKTEIGVEYTVISDDHLGFTIKRCQETLGNEKNKAVVNQTLDSSEKSAYRQALRGFLPQYAEIVAGLVLAMSPYTVLGWIFAFLNIQTIPEWFSLPGWGKVFSASGYLLILYGLRFIYSYYSRKLFIEEECVLLKKGIIAQDHIQIRFVDIKTVGIRQSILERFLSIGTLHLASAGTNGEVDIIFNKLINPANMRNRIRKLIEKAVLR